MQIDAIASLLDTIPAASSIVVVILFLKYIKSRDQKDMKIHRDCEATIKSIIKTHDTRIAANDIRVENLVEKVITSQSRKSK